MNSIFKYALIAAALGAVVPAHAHRAWMLPSATVLSGEDPWITVDAAVSNNLFYFEHFPLRLSGIGETDSVNRTTNGRTPSQLQITAPNGTQLVGQNGNTGRYRTTFDVHLTQKGTYKLALENARLMATYTENGERGRWVGELEDLQANLPGSADDVEVIQSNSRMEVFVTSGKPTETVFQTTGKGLEITPLTHPNDLYAGETAEFVFTIDGEPAADIDVNVIPGGNRYRDELGEMTLKTNADGKVDITWPAAGMYWFEAEFDTTEGVTPPVTRRRASYSATLEVMAP
jgi:uncharacterized GH25 family protein